MLQMQGQDVWAPTLQAVRPALSSRGASLEQLVVSNDEPHVEDLGDGVRATGLMPTVIVPGLYKCDYPALLHVIGNRFRTCGNIVTSSPGNFFTFPYDWRRDNRFTAAKLKVLIDEQLPRWRQYYSEAKVILIAHSMGGLMVLSR